MSPSVPTTALESVREQFSSVLVKSAEAVSFWLAIALPFLYLPLLMGGLTGQEAFVFGGLLVANVVTLVVGHGYHSDGYGD